MPETIQRAAKRTMAAPTRPAFERTTFRTSRLLDFTSEKELTAQVGHPKATWPVVVLKELVDNAIDAAEEAGMAPAVSVVVDDRGITVEDNGPGIPAEVVEGVLDFSVRVSSREAYVSPTRGAQGNALKTIVAMPFVLDGHRGRTVIEAKSVRHVIEVGVDRIRQEPIVDHRTEASDVRTGTRVTVAWPDSARSILEAVMPQFLQVATQYIWLNPHLSLAVTCPGMPEPVAWRIEASDAGWEKWRPSDPTSPHWYTPTQLERLIAGYIADDADHGRGRTVRELIAEFRGLSGTARQKAVLAETSLARAPLTALVNGHDLNHGLIATLLEAMKAQSKPVKPQQLGIIGREHLGARMAEYGCEMASFDYRRAMATTDEVPWVVESAFGWCPRLTGRLLVTGVNWSPGILNPFRELGRFGQSLDTILSQQRVSRDDPVILVLHMACPRVEYTDRGKSAVVVR